MHAVVRGAARQVRDARRGDHRLGRRAADVDAGAADVLTLHDRGLAAGAPERERERLAGLAGADDDGVEHIRGRKCHVVPPGRIRIVGRGRSAGLTPVNMRGAPL
jgi:hypothetical protein